jgi:hypothetical protein
MTTDTAGRGYDMLGSGQRPSYGWPGSMTGEPGATSPAS